MIKVTFIGSDGVETTVDARENANVMELAVQHGVEGIAAECGGAMMCATCHGYIDAAWTDKVGGPSDDETEMLEFASSDINERSRLCCQLTLSAELDGLVVHLPDSQN